MNLKCNRCKWEWEYQGDKTFNGKYPVYTSCPRCRSQVKLIDEKKK
jgi:hypothetical protein